MTEDRLPLAELLQKAAEVVFRVPPLTRISHHHAGARLSRR